MEILAHMAQAKQAEYVIALIGLFGYIGFWMVLNGPTVGMEAVKQAVKPIMARIAGFLVPDDVLFHPGHSWVRVESDEIITVGMDDFAAKLLGSVDSISLPPAGSRVKQGCLGWALKADSRPIHMLSPIDGEVVAINDAVVHSPSVAFEDPYGKGWLLKVKNGNPTPNLKNMIPTGMVERWFESIRETLAGRQLALAEAALLQDGGEPVAGIAKAIEPDRWDDLARELFLTK